MEMLKIEQPEDLNDHLLELNEQGTNPVVVGFDRHLHPFLAYGHAPGGDGWDVGILYDDPYSYEFDLADVTRCEECHSEGRRPVTDLQYPVMVLEMRETT